MFTVDIYFDAQQGGFYGINNFSGKFTKENRQYQKDIDKILNGRFVKIYDTIEGLKTIILNVTKNIMFNEK